MKYLNLKVFLKGITIGFTLFHWLSCDAVAANIRGDIPKDYNFLHGCGHFCDSGTKKLSSRAIKFEISVRHLKSDSNPDEQPLNVEFYSSFEIFSNSTHFFNYRVLDYKVEKMDNMATLTIIVVPRNAVTWQIINPPFGVWDHLYIGISDDNKHGDVIGRVGIIWSLEGNLTERVRSPLPLSNLDPEKHFASALTEAPHTIQNCIDIFYPPSHDQDWQIILPPRPLNYEAMQQEDAMVEKLYDYFWTVVQSVCVIYEPGPLTKINPKVETLVSPEPHTSVVKVTIDI